MVLEATMIIVDNSESSRNGDYLPSRFGAQSEAVSMIFNAKTNANPESSVGLMSMGGKGPEVLVTLTTDIGKVLDGLHRTRIWGDGHLSTGISVAGLALKHRQNKSQRQRIIVFTCSSLAHEDEKALGKLAKRMKKNNISIDFVAFGDLESDTKSKLEAFNDNVKGGDGSHLVIVPPGPRLLSDHLLTSPILAAEGAGGSGGGGGGENGGGATDGAGPGAVGAGAGGSGGGTGFEFGIDPSVDPELAMALRMSMEEETNRLERQRREREEAELREREKERLERIPEEGGAGGEASRDEGAGAGAGAGASAEGGEGPGRENPGKEGEEGKDKHKDGEGAAGDRMDTA